MAEVNDCLSAINGLFLLVEERNYPDDGLADDDSWVDNISQDGNDTNELDSVSDSYLQTNREEDFQEYNDYNALDFTLHTIVEESCEDSELEHDNGIIKSNELNGSEISRISPSELERYYFFGLGDGDKEETILEDSSSEIFSDCSENCDTIGKNDVYSSDTKYALDLSTSRLEKYFLSGFMGFSSENKSDGSVGSDSEGQPSPSHRKKKFVRARGTPRSINSSLDNLLLESSDLVSDQVTESLGSSESETDSLPEMGTSCDKLDSIESVKRKKYRKRDLLEQNKSNIECKTSNMLDTAVDINCQDSSIKAEANMHSNFNLQINRFTNISPLSAKKSLVRKDSFNNWSSDEETNLMMSKMRQFFKTLIVVTTQNYAQSNSFGTYSSQIFQERRCKTKPVQFSYFENELIRLMKSVPGINNQQVRDIVEYFSSEDTWSDSNDSSDCNVSNDEIDLKKSKNEQHFDYLKNKNGSAGVGTSTVSSVSVNKPMSTESVLVYTNFIESLITNNSRLSPEVNIENKYNNSRRCNDKSPQLVANVMQHIGRKLVALMHDVSIGADSNIEPEIEIQQKNKTQPEENSTKVVLDHIDYSRHVWGHLPRSKSHDILLGSTNRTTNTFVDNPGEVSDCDRFSWRGSFESALLAPGDSRNKLLTVDRDNCSLSSEVSITKRGSVDNLTYAINQNREQLDRVQSCGSIGIVDKESRSDIQKTRISSLSDIKNKTELHLPSSRIKVEKLINTNSLPRLQTLKFSDVSDKLQSDVNVIQSNVKSARYRSPSNIQTNIFSSLSKKNNLQSSALQSSDKRGITSSTSLDDFSISEFSNNISPGLQRNHFYKRNNANFGTRSDSLTSVYSDAFDNRYDNIRVKGKIEFAMQYNYKISAFEIHIVKCKDLAAADTKRCKSDPYVKVYLLPDKSKNGKRKTKVKKHTLNPIFDEIMRFNVSIADLETRSVWLTVWHSDMFGRNDFLGEVTINLHGKVFDNPQSQWYFLQEKNEEFDEIVRYRGDMVVGLKFISLDSQGAALDCSFSKMGTIKPHNKGELHVLIKEAKHLPSLRSSGTCDTFCKSYLLPNRSRSSKQKTPIFKKSLAPSWNYTFIYEDVTLHELSERALELTIWDHDRLISNQFLGGARFSLGTGKHNGNKVTWMDSKGKELFLWKEMMSRPNFWVEGCVKLRPLLETKREETNEC